MSLYKELEELADELVGYQIGEGYYSMDLGPTEAREIAEIVMPWIEEHYVPKASAVVEWGAGFVETGQRYNSYRTQREAESFVRSMNEVGANMVVMTREYTPTFATDWRAV